MANTRRLSAYVDYQILDLAAFPEMPDTARTSEWDAIRRIWDLFRADSLSLVTSVDEMELDFVIQMNRGGLCVTDTFQITDNIDTFEVWKEADRNDTGHWRAIVELYDQLDIISGHDDMVEDHIHPKLYEHVASVLRERRKDEAPSGLDEETAILRDCAASLHTVYDMQLWADLKHIQYALNWEVLKGVLPRYSHDASLHGADASLNKNLLGLVNRLVNISKKSCPRLPMTEKHIDFVLDIVRKKYCQEDADRQISHITHALRNGVDFHLTTDRDLIDRFTAGKGRLQELLDTPITLEVLRPSELVVKTGHG